ncbi:MAG TPA: sulfurtransferase TusA family protein [Roseiflexaceae bacterium]|nr:sulfurtransferase TusA family protein [Roseiflexaceae bacterium]
MAAVTLDAGPANCGRLIHLVAEAMARVQPGQLLLVTAYDPSSQLDLAAWCRMTGHRLCSVQAVDDHLMFAIEKAIPGGAHNGTRNDPQHARQG